MVSGQRSSGYQDGAPDLFTVRKSTIKTKINETLRTTSPGPSGSNNAPQAINDGATLNESRLTFVAV